MSTTTVKVSADQFASAKASFKALTKEFRSTLPFMGKELFAVLLANAREVNQAENADLKGWQDKFRLSDEQDDQLAAAKAAHAAAVEADKKAIVKQVSKATLTSYKVKMSGGGLKFTLKGVMKA